MPLPESDVAEEVSEARWGRPDEHHQRFVVTPVVGVQADAASFEPVPADVGREASIVLRRHARQLPVGIFEELCSFLFAHALCLQPGHCIVPCVPASRRTEDQRGVHYEPGRDEKAKVDLTGGPVLQNGYGEFVVTIRTAMLYGMCCLLAY